MKRITRLLLIVLLAAVVPGTSLLLAGCGRKPAGSTAAAQESAAAAATTQESAAEAAATTQESAEAAATTQESAAAAATTQESAAEAASQESAAAAAAAQETAAAQDTPADKAGWTREGYAQDADGHILYVVWMEDGWDGSEPGWYVGLSLGEDWNTDAYGGIVPLVDGALHGSIPSGNGEKEIMVTVTEEGEDGLAAAVEGGETYHFTLAEAQDATIFVSVNVEGMGCIAYAEGEETPETDPEFPAQSAVINLAEPKMHTFLAWSDDRSRFVKWTKNGEDFSTEPQVSVLLDESADYIAVFEDNPDWVHPAFELAGQYQSGRASADVSCWEYDEVFVVVDWGSSASEVTRWILVGKYDPQTGVVQYADGSKADLVFNSEGDVEEENQVYSDGTGTITFREDGSFVWHEDQAEDREDMVFEKLPEQEE